MKKAAGMTSDIQCHTCQLLLGLIVTGTIVLALFMNSVLVWTSLIPIIPAFIIAYRHRKVHNSDDHSGGRRKLVRIVP